MTPDLTFLRRARLRATHLRPNVDETQQCTRLRGNEKFAVWRARTPAQHNEYATRMQQPCRSYFRLRRRTTARPRSGEPMRRTCCVVACGASTGARKDRSHHSTHDSCVEVQSLRRTRISCETSSPQSKTAASARRATWLHQECTERHLLSHAKMASQADRACSALARLRR